MLFTVDPKDFRIFLDCYRYRYTRAVKMESAESLFTGQLDYQNGFGSVSFAFSISCIWVSISCIFSATAALFLSQCKKQKPKETTHKDGDAVGTEAVQPPTAFKLAPSRNNR